MIRAILLIVLQMILIPVIAQENSAVNQVDEKGLKQGKWVKYFPGGNIKYEGEFKNNIPVGSFTRYYEKGGKSSILEYTEGSEVIKATFFHPNGFKAAEGTYNGKNREGIWKFYSEQIKDYMVCKENYRNGKKEGQSIKYHWNGNKAEELYYKDNLKDGQWLQYYTDEVLCIRSTYIKGKLEGKFETFHTNGMKEIIGTYRNDTRDGIWTFYSEKGVETQKIIYHNGVPENMSELLQKASDYLDSLEINGGKIVDPEKHGIEKFRL